MGRTDGQTDRRTDRRTGRTGVTLNALPLSLNRRGHKNTISYSRNFSQIEDFFILFYEKYLLFCIGKGSLYGTRICRHKNPC